MKAVIYARYSSDSQREESIEGQLRECTAFAEKNGITILRHYIDRAFSAKTDNRPEFQNMIKDSGKKLFDMVIVWKLDRFARNRYDSARYKSTLKKNGVKVVSATEVISDGAEGIILESVLEGYAEYYSADLSEKVIRGMTDNALKCKYNGGTMPIGYTIDDERHFQIDPLTAPFVLDAFKKYDAGATMTEVRDWLNVKGATNTLGRELNYNSVQLMLNNRRYIGEFRYRDVIIPDGIPAIVPQDLFDSVQEKMAKNKKAPARHKAEDDYLLTTKLFCGHCGAYLCGESGTGRKQVYHYYKCVNAKKHKTCKKKPVQKNWLEDLVINETMKIVMDDKAIEAIVSMVIDLQGRESTSLPLYEQQLQEANIGIQNLLNAIQQGILTPSTKTRLEELEANKEDLEIKIASENLIRPKVDAEFVKFWLHRFRKLDVRQQAHRKMLIDTFINAIYLYDDKIIITFNYKDGTKTINIDDIKGSDLDCPGAPLVADCTLVRDDFIWSVWLKSPLTRFVTPRCSAKRRARLACSVDKRPRDGSLSLPPFHGKSRAWARSSSSRARPRFFDFRKIRQIFFEFCNNFLLRSHTNTEDPKVFDSNGKEKIMNKFLKSSLTVLLLLTLTATLLMGCNSGKDPSNPEGETGQIENDPGEAEGGSDIQVPNPIVEYETLEEAFAAAGITPKIPSLLGEATNISVIDTKIFQAVYNLNTEVTFRSATAGMGTDLSGDFDYSTYTDKKTVENADGIQVTLAGTDGLYRVASWTADGLDYTLTVADGADEATLLPWTEL